MKVHPAIIGIAVCTVLGGVLAYFTHVKWLAASLFVLAAMHLNGTIAVIEDAQPGGLDNPDGNEEYDSRRLRRTFYSSLAIAFAAVAAGAYVQLR